MKTFETQFQLSAQIDSAFGGAFGKGQQAIASMQGEIQALNRVQSDITSFEKQQTAVDNTKKKVELYEQQLANLKREYDETGNSSSALQNKMLEKEQQIDKTNQTLKTQEERLEATSEKLRAAGVDTDQLGNASAETAQKVEQLKEEQKKAAEEAEKFGQKSSQAVSDLHQALMAAGIVKLFKEIYSGFQEIIQISMDFEDQMAAASATTDIFGDDLTAMGHDLRKLSTEIPVPALELAKLAEMAGQLGVSSEYVSEFAQVMSAMAVTTTLTSEEAALNLAKFANIVQISQGDFERLGSTFLEIGDSMSSTDNEIAAMAPRLAAAGKQANMTAGDIIGISGALTSMGIEAQAGGSAFSKVINQMTAAVELGSDRLDDFAAVAGMSADEFAKAYRDNAAGALTSFIEGLADMDRHGQSTIVLLDELGLKEQRMRDALARTAVAGDLLRDAISLGNQAWEENIALSESASTRYATTQNQLIMMENATMNLKMAIGDALTPTLNDLYSSGTDVISTFAEFIEQNPQLVKSVTAFIGVLGGVVVALAAYTVIAKAVRILNVALAGSFGPIMIVAAAVAALTAVYVGLASAAESAQKESRELARANDEFLASVNASEGAYADRVQKIQNEVGATRSLIGEVYALAEASGKSAEDKQRLATMVDLLNDSMEGLNLQYDIEKDSLDKTRESLEAVIDAREREMRTIAARERALEIAREQIEVEEKLILTQEKLPGLIEEYNQKVLRGLPANRALLTSILELEENEADLIDRQAELAGSMEYVTGIMDESASSVNQLATANAVAEASYLAMETAVSEMEEALQELADTYDAVHSAALTSVQGQYDLWDKADKVVATKIGSINTNLEGQAARWQDYNANLQNLAGRTGEIEGLGDVIASFADGSKESVNAIAGMAAATDDELKAMVANWQSVQAEQDAVATSIADLAVDIAGETAKIVSRFEGMVSDMNLSTEAANSARQTIQGFIRGAEGMLPQVKAAFEKVATTAMKAIDDKMKIQSPSKEMEYRAQMTWIGFIEQTYAMEKQVAEAMASVAHAGTQAVTHETQIVSLAPEFVNALSSYGSGTGGLDIGGIHIEIIIDADVTTDPEKLRATLDKAGDTIADAIIAKIEEKQHDAYRRSYK